MWGIWSEKPCQPPENFSQLRRCRRCFFGGSNRISASNGARIQWFHCTVLLGLDLPSGDQRWDWNSMEIHYPWRIRMYAILWCHIYHQYTPNVSIYTIHGSYGLSIEGDFFLLKPPFIGGFPIANRTTKHAEVAKEKTYPKPSRISWLRLYYR